MTNDRLLSALSMSATRMLATETHYSQTAGGLPGRLDPLGSPGEGRIEVKSVYTTRTQAGLEA